MHPKSQIGRIERYHAVDVGHLKRLTHGSCLYSGLDTAVAPTTTAAVTSCGTYAFAPQSSDLANNISVVGATCSTAKAVVAAAPDRPNTGSAYSAKGFRCDPGPETQPPGGGMSHWHYTCATGSGASVTFDRY